MLRRTLLSRALAKIQTSGTREAEVNKGESPLALEERDERTIFGSLGGGRNLLISELGKRERPGKAI